MKVGIRGKKADLKQGSWTWPIYKKALDNKIKVHDKESILGIT